MPYRLAMAQSCNFLSYKKAAGVFRLLRVDTGIRTLGLQSHNLARCDLLVPNQAL